MDTEHPQSTSLSPDTSVAAESSRAEPHALLASNPEPPLTSPNDWLVKSASWLFALACLSLHAMITWYYFGGSKALQSQNPPLIHDFSYVYHNAKVGATSLAQTGSVAAYDPQFMAGYANSFISSSNQLAPLFVWVVGPEHAAFGYNLHTLVMVSTIPLTLMLAARWYGLSLIMSSLCTLLWTFVFWGSIFHNYLLWGMLAFVYQVGWSALLGASVCWFFDEPAWRRAWVMGIMAGLAFMMHTTVPVIMLPGCVVCLLSNWPGTRWHIWSKLLVALLVCLTLNLYWLGPIMTVWPTLGKTPTFFVNDNVRERLLEVFTSLTDEVRASVMLGGLGLVAMWRCLKRSSSIMLTVTCLWLFFLAYLAGGFRMFDVLQPGRNTLTSIGFWVMPASILLVQACRSWRWAIPAVVALVLVAPNLMWHVRYAIGSVQAVSEERRGLPLELPGTLTRCRRAIKQHMGDFKRIWFEDCSVGQQNPPDPFGSFRVTPILARDTKLEFIGGPYARPHYRTQSTQFVDGSLHGHDAVTPELIRTLADGYGVDSIVCWSPGWKQYCAANPTIFEPLFGYVGDPNYDDRFVGYRIKRAQLPHEKLGVKLVAKVNQISLEVPSNAIGTTILIPYHWVPGLRAQGAELSPQTVPFDAVPFISLKLLDAHVTVSYHPWSLSR